MGLNDGYMRKKELYVTSDIALAAYLLLRGYELLGAIDNGSKRREFGVTHTSIKVLEDMEADVEAKAHEYESQYLPIPQDPEARLNFRMYYRMIKELHHALDEPIKVEEL